MAAIHHSLAAFQQGKVTQVVAALSLSSPSEILSVGDQWLIGLNNLLHAAKEISGILERTNAFCKNPPLAHQPFFKC